MQLLARDGVRFTNAYTIVPTSAPAYATLLSGMTPSQHGVFFNEQALDSTIPLVQEALRERGYETAGVVSNGYCGERHGFSRGFDYFWDEIKGRGKAGWRVTDAAIEWLDRRDADRPFFLFLAYMDAHRPFITDGRMPTLLVRLNGRAHSVIQAEGEHRVNEVVLRLEPGRNLVELQYLDGLRAAEPWDQDSPLRILNEAFADRRVELEFVSGCEPGSSRTYRRLKNRATLLARNSSKSTLEGVFRFQATRDYSSEEHLAYYLDGVRAFDRELGRLVGYLRKQGLYDDAALVFVSDHGEMLGEHGAWGHIRELYQEDVRIPLVVEAPGLPAGTTDSRMLDIADLHRWLPELAADAASALVPAGRTGRNRSEILLAAYPPSSEQRLAALIRGRYKLLADAAEERIELYDLRTDPRESENLYPSLGDTAEIRSMEKTLRRHLDQVRRAQSIRLESLTQAERQRLQALGYLE